MQTALYHPERGYYTSRIKTVGRGGDFATSATLSDSLARAIAHQFQKSGLRNLIEVGPGDGSLAATIRRNLPLFKRLRLQQHLVELSPVLSAQQKKRNPKARHHSSIASALQICQGHAFIYSNELVDAFPVRIFRTSAAAAPEELFLNQQSSTWHESWQPATNLPASTFFSTKLNPHQRFEVHETYHTWFSSWQDHWHTGQILT
ncbi:MAG: SAM-dependent methyltransferase, partial [Verrucomicrobiota bacterium]